MTRIIAKLRKEIESLNEKIQAHKAVTSPSREILRRFVLNQLYIVPHDLKALSTLLAGARSDVEINFFKLLVDGDFSAYASLLELSRELNIKLDMAQLSPRAVSYTHFLAWLSLHGTAGDAAVALTVNLPVWGANTQKIGEWAKDQAVKSTHFFELFKGPYHELEEKAETIAERYLDWQRYRFVSMAIQQYELDFWDAIL